MRRRFILLAGLAASLACVHVTMAPSESDSGVGPGGAQGGGGGGGTGARGGSGGTLDAGGPSGAAGAGGAAGSGGSAGSGTRDGGQGGTAGVPDAGADKGSAADSVGADGSVGKVDGGAAAVSGICDPGAIYGSPLPEHAVATLVKDGYGFLEGPVWVASQGALYFSDTNWAANSKPESSRMYKHTPAADKFELFIGASGANGLAMHPNGKIVAATHDTQSLSFFDPITKAREQVPGSGMYMGKKFNSPNDLTARSDGYIYFSDPPWQQDGRPGQDAWGVYGLSPTGVVTRIDVRQGIYGPNGVHLSPDEKYLYVGGGDGKIKRHNVKADGSADAGAMFTVYGGDGLGMDCAGNLYIATGDGVPVVDPTGKTIGKIATPGNAFTSNVAFGGADRKTLYITGTKHLWSIRLNVPGYPN